MKADHGQKLLPVCAAVACATAVASTAAGAGPAYTPAESAISVGAAAVLAGNNSANLFPTLKLPDITPEDDPFAVGALGPSDKFLHGIFHFQGERETLYRGDDYKDYGNVGLIEPHPLVAARGTADAPFGRHPLLKSFGGELRRRDEPGLGGLDDGPETKFGFAVSNNAWAALSGLGAYRKGPVDEVDAIADCYSTGSTASNCITFVADSRYVDGNVTGLNAPSSSDFPNGAGGAYVTQVGLSLVREFGSRRSGYVVGLTPKYVIADVVDEMTDAQSAGTAYLSDAGRGSRYEHFNADVGIAGDLGDGWRTGLVVKNVLPQEYETAQNGAVRLTPQARISIARPIDW